MKKLNVVLCLVLSLILATSLFGCGKDNNTKSPGEEKSTIDEIKAKGYIVWGTEPTFPPFEMMSGDNVIGVDAEIAAAIAEKLGVELKVETVDFDALPNALVSGTIDFIAAGYTVDPDREKEVLFTDKYFKAKQVIIVQEDNDEIKGFDDIADKSVGVQNGTSGDYLAEDLGANNVQYNTAIEAALDLKNGKLDAVVLDDIPAQIIVEQNSGLRIITDDSVDVEEYALAVRLDDTELQEVINEVLGELKADGKIDEWVEDYSFLE